MLSTVEVCPIDRIKYPPTLISTDGKVYSVNKIPVAYSLYFGFEYTVESGRSMFPTIEHTWVLIALSAIPGTCAIVSGIEERFPINRVELTKAVDTFLNIFHSSKVDSRLVTLPECTVTYQFSELSHFIKKAIEYNPLEVMLVKKPKTNYVLIQDILPA